MGEIFTSHTLLRNFMRKVPLQMEGPMKPACVGDTIYILFTVLFSRNVTENFESRFSTGRFDPPPRRPEFKIRPRFPHFSICLSIVFSHERYARALFSFLFFSFSFTRVALYSCFSIRRRGGRPDVPATYRRADLAAAPMCRTWTSPKRNKLQIRSLLLRAQA